MNQAKKYQPLTREGLRGYFEQGYYNKETARVDWDLDTLITIMLTSDHQAYEQGRADAWRWREYPAEKPTDNNFCLVMLDDGGTMQSHYSLPDDDWIDDAPITHWLPIQLPGDAK